MRLLEFYRERSTRSRLGIVLAIIGAATRGGYVLRVGRSTINVKSRSSYLKFKHRDGGSCVVRVADHGSGTFKTDHRARFALRIGCSSRWLDQVCRRLESGPLPVS